MPPGNPSRWSGSDADDRVRESSSLCSRAMARRSSSQEAPSLWREAIANLHVFKRKGERAVHKPLLTLMLLRLAGAGESRVTTYREIEEPLAKLIKEFGPPGRRPRPDYPFWHLQTDGLWVIRDAASIPLRKSGSNPRVTVLRDRDVAGEVPKELWDAVSTDERLREELTEQVLTDYWPETLHASIRAAVGLPDPGLRGGKETLPSRPQVPPRGLESLRVPVRGLRLRRPPRRRALGP